MANIDDPASPVEKNDTTYRFIGARFRYVIVPKFYMGIFADGGSTVGVPAFGPEFTIRKNGFEYVMSMMYASYAMDPTPFLDSARRLQRLPFPMPPGWAPGQTGSNAAPEPGAILLSVSDISTADGADAESLRAAIDTPQPRP